MEQDEFAQLLEQVEKAKTELRDAVEAAYVREGRLCLLLDKLIKLEFRKAAGPPPAPVSR